MIIFLNNHNNNKKFHHMTLEIFIFIKIKMLIMNN